MIPVRLSIHSRMRSNSLFQLKPFLPFHSYFLLNHHFYQLFTSTNPSPPPTPHHDPNSRSTPTTNTPSTTPLKFPNASTRSASYPQRSPDSPPQATSSVTVGYTDCSLSRSPACPTSGEAARWRFGLRLRVRARRRRSISRSR